MGTKCAEYYQMTKEERKNCTCSWEEHVVVIDIDNCPKHGIRRTEDE